MMNMPIARYLEWLLQSGNLESYLQRLAGDRAALETRRIVVRRHGFGCTAGAGSSWGGITV